jgi:hypothetical protein
VVTPGLKVGANLNDPCSFLIDLRNNAIYIKCCRHDAF